MNISDLPEEIVIYIINKLDFDSCLVLYNTCHYFRRMVSMKSVIKECNFSMNVWATCYSLQLSLFRDISGHLQKLNLSAVTNLNQRTLVRALMNMPRLKSLNVSYTSIKIMDLVGVEKYCHNLSELTINFDYEKILLQRETIIKCKNFFKNFKYIHFIGSPACLLFNTLGLMMLEDANLNTINFTLSEDYDGDYPAPPNVRINKLKFKNFNIYLHHNYFHYVLNDLEEILIINMLQEMISGFIVLYAEQDEITNTYYSPAFKRLFKEQPEAKCTEYMKSISYCSKNIAIMLWNKDNVYDHYFYKQMEKRLGNLPYIVKTKDSLVPAQCKWIFVNEEYINDEVNDENRVKRRCTDNTFVLDYNKMLSETKDVQLTVSFKNVSIVYAEFPTDYSYLSKITSLCLRGPLGCDVDFFLCLIRNCVNLKTLSIISSTVFTPIMSLSRLLPMSKSLRNYRVVAKNINLDILFTNLAKCTNFENIYIENINNVTDPPMFPDPVAIFKNCKNLYSFVIVDSFTNNNKKRKALLYLKECKNKVNKTHLNVNVHNNRDNHRYVRHSPFLQVFNETTLKLI